MFPQFDPSKMDPKVLMEVSQLLQQLPPDKIMKLQSLMHNMMAGFDVSKEMAEFEQTLPPGFREKLTSLLLSQAPQAFAQGQGAVPPQQAQVQPMSTPASPQAPAPEPAFSDEDMGIREARLTVLRAVAEGRMSPEDAERLLFAAS